MDSEQKNCTEAGAPLPRAGPAAKASYGRTSENTMEKSIETVQETYIADKSTANVGNAEINVGVKDTDENVISSKFHNSVNAIDSIDTVKEELDRIDNVDGEDSSHASATAWITSDNSILTDLPYTPGQGNLGITHFLQPSNNIISLHEVDSDASYATDYDQSTDVTGCIESTSDEKNDAKFSNNVERIIEELVSDHENTVHELHLEDNTLKTDLSNRNADKDVKCNDLSGMCVRSIQLSDQNPEGTYLVRREEFNIKAKAGIQSTIYKAPADSENANHGTQIEVKCSNWENNYKGKHPSNKAHCSTESNDQPMLYIEKTDGQKRVTPSVHKNLHNNMSLKSVNAFSPKKISASQSCLEHAGDNAYRRAQHNIWDTRTKLQSRDRSRSPIKIAHRPSDEEVQCKRVRESTKLTSVLLSEYSSEDPDEITAKLGSDTKRLSDYFEQATEDIQINGMLLGLLDKCFSSDNLPMLQLQVINTMIDEKYVQKSIRAMQIAVSEDEDKAMTVVDPLTKLINIVNIICDRTPSSLLFISGTFCLIKSFIEIIEVIPNADVRLVKDGFDLLKIKKDKCMQPKSLARKQAEENDTVEHAPPNNFRDIPIFPQTSDLSPERPYLRVNKVPGAYDSLDHYLDVHFRLLREDFVGPLREGIANYVGHTSLKRLKNIDNLRMYENVRIVTTVYGDEVNHVIHFDIAKFKRVRWNTTDRLKYGSLVCLSNDNFATSYCATVVDNNEKQNGQITVNFTASVAEIKPLIGIAFTMAESVAYFEAFRHVLSSLQQIHKGDLASFDRYIVECKTDVLPPKYLRENPEICFDLQSLHDENSLLFTNGDYLFPGRTYMVRRNGGLPEDLEPLRKVKLLNDEWPDKDVLHLDASQLQAVKSALTKEFSVIQGPPGCGKTYIGLKIVKALLHNESAWSYPHSSPILIVCYTNHALDQFLEGINEFYDGNMVRVGSRSKSTVLEKFNLTVLRHSLRREYEFKEMNQKKGQAKCQMNLLKGDINFKAKEIEICQNNIIREEALGKEMGRICFNQFAYAKRHAPSNIPIQHDFLGDSAIVRWLCIDQELDAIHQGIHVTTSRFIEDEAEDINIYFPELERERLYEFSEDTSVGLISTAETDWLKSEYVAFDLQKALQKPYELTATAWEYTKHEIYTLVTNLKAKLCSFDLMSDDEASQAIDIFSDDFTKDQRWRLYRYWIHKKCQMINEDMHKSAAEIEEANTEIRTLHADIDKKIMERAKVIGMTTTCAAKHQSVLKDIKPSIMVVEEAAEVFESHLVSNITSGCQQLILIGDHKQLKPKPNMYVLAKKYNFDISLFERMVRNNIHLDCLDTQHRMRPEIANFTRNVYPQLKDHESVHTYGQIKGIARNMYFVDHSFDEMRDDGTKSYSNVHEAEFLVGLCQYILRQGYSPTSITILTPYVSQMFLLKKTMIANSIDKNVKVTAVDNYQGEENDIILLSLVRSNSNSKIGFLSSENRICVMLSRAKKGLFAIGNFELLSKKSSLWSKIVKELKQKENISPQLPLKCQNHPNDDATLIKSRSDFEHVPSGGCKKRCDVRLNCGHACDRICHIEDRNHCRPCKKQCTRKCENGHMSCSQLCFEPCICVEIVEKTIPKCGHNIFLQCFEDPNKCICTEMCEVDLKCGHSVKIRCLERAFYKCNVECEQTLRCGHSTVIPCWKTDAYNRNELNFDCSERCNVELSCGHTATIKCYEIKTYQCMIQCKRALNCGHTAVVACSKLDLYVCKEPCKKRFECGHRCRNKCYEDCKPCPMETTRLRADCGHQVKIKCSDDVSDVRCLRVCGQQLNCGHKCTAVCGERNQHQSTESSQTETYLSKLSQCKFEHSIKCTEMCTSRLACGHRCKGCCSECFRGDFHVACSRKCHCNLICGHLCTGTCSSCSVCRRPAEPRCYHRMNHMKMMCTDKHIPCNKPCTWNCPHFKCENLCHEPCNRVRCNEPCAKSLPCGHRCIGLCGEVCPYLCRLCNTGLLAKFVYQHCDVNNGLLIKLDCGHFVNYEIMDEYMDEVEAPYVVKRCPVCRQPIYRSHRYGNVVKATLRAIDDVKKSVFENSLYKVEKPSLQNAGTRLMESLQETRDCLSSDNTATMQDHISDLIFEDKIGSEMLETAFLFGGLVTKQRLKDVERLINYELDTYCHQTLMESTVSKLKEIVPQENSKLQDVSAIFHEVRSLYNVLEGYESDEISERKRKQLTKRLIASYNKWFNSKVQRNVVKLSFSNESSELLPINPNTRSTCKHTVTALNGLQECSESSVLDTDSEALNTDTLSPKSFNSNDSSENTLQESATQALPTSRTITDAAMISNAGSTVASELTSSSLIASVVQRDNSVSENSGSTKCMHDKPNKSLYIESTSCIKSSVSSDESIKNSPSQKSNFDCQIASAETGIVQTGFEVADINMETIRAIVDGIVQSVAKAECKTFLEQGNNPVCLVATEGGSCGNTTMHHFVDNLKGSSESRVKSSEESSFIDKIKGNTATDISFIDRVKLGKSSFMQKIKASANKDDTSREILNVGKSKTDFLIENLLLTKASDDSFMSKIGRCESEEESLIKRLNASRKSESLTNMLEAKLCSMGHENENIEMENQVTAETVDIGTTTKQAIESNIKLDKGKFEIVGLESGHDMKIRETLVCKLEHARDGNLCLKSEQENNEHANQNRDFTQEETQQAMDTDVPDNIIYIELKQFTGWPYFNCPVSTFKIKKSAKSANRKRTSRLKTELFASSEKSTDKQAKQVSGRRSEGNGTSGPESVNVLAGSSGDTSKPSSNNRAVESKDTTEDLGTRAGQKRTQRGVSLSTNSKTGLQKHGHDSKRNDKKPSKPYTQIDRKEDRHRPHKRYHSKSHEHGKHKHANRRKDSKQYVDNDQQFCDLKDKDDSNSFAHVYNRHEHWFSKDNGNRNRIPKYKSATGTDEQNKRKYECVEGDIAPFHHRNFGMNNTSENTSMANYEEPRHEMRKRGNAIEDHYSTRKRQKADLDPHMLSIEDYSHELSNETFEDDHDRPTEDRYQTMLHEDRGIVKLYHSHGKHGRTVKRDDNLPRTNGNIYSRIDGSSSRRGGSRHSRNVSSSRRDGSGHRRDASSSRTGDSGHSRDGSSSRKQTSSSGHKADDRSSRRHNRSDRRGEHSNNTDDHWHKRDDHSQRRDYSNSRRDGSVHRRNDHSNRRSDHTQGRDDNSSGRDDRIRRRDDRHYRRGDSGYGRDDHSHCRYSHRCSRDDQD